MSTLRIDVLIVGVGEYTTGFVQTDDGAAIDKKFGVVGLVMFDLRRLGVVNRVVFAGTNGTKFPNIREHFKNTIESTYADMDTRFESFPADTVPSDPLAYRAAIDSMSRGDAVFIYTPDQTHFDIAKYALEKGLNVMVTKPMVKTLGDHHTLVQTAKKERRYTVP
eukprot:PhM_4_TR18000/c0_g1_i1/m.89121/K18106/GAAA; D-galacturonate reductase